MYFHKRIEIEGNNYDVDRPLFLNTPCQWSIRFDRGIAERLSQSCFAIMEKAWLVNGHWYLRVMRNTGQYDRKDSNLEQDEHEALIQKYKPILDKLIEIAEPEYNEALAARAKADKSTLTKAEQLIGCASIFITLFYCLVR